MRYYDYITKKARTKVYDYHIHTKFSYDGYEKLSDFCAFASGRKMRGICFTEHLDLLHPYPLPNGGRLDMEAYRKTVEEARKEFPSLNIRIGLEAGAHRDNIKETAAFLAKQKLDFIILSQHTAGGGDPDFDKSLFEKYGEKGYLKQYLAEMAQTVRDFPDFDVVGHIGYAARYLPEPKPLTYDDFPEETDRILKTVIDRGRGIEVNSSGLFTVKSAMPHISVIKRYTELGGKIITFGSDAHFLNVLGHAYEETMRDIRDAGAEHICTFKNRKPCFHNI